MHTNRYSPIADKLDLEIYPNPVKDIATFSSDEFTSIEVYDLKGALVIKGNAIKVEMTNLNPGIYFVIGYDKNNLSLYEGKIIKI